VFKIIWLYEYKDINKRYFWTATNQSLNECPGVFTLGLYF
jgi:hypothetical protein